MDSDGHDPLGIRDGARFVAERSDHVSIERQALAAYCRALLPEMEMPRSEWDSGHHFCGEKELTIAYVFVLDTINFSFWGDPKWRRSHEGRWLDGYWALAAALTEEAARNPMFLDPHRLAELEAAALGAVLKGSPTIPLLEARAANLRELGSWVVARFGGSFSNILPAVAMDAIELVRLLARELVSFRDEALYKGRMVPFHKRAQILASDLHGASGKGSWGPLSRMRELTAFADYKLPQILRHRGVLRYADPLAWQVDSELPLQAGSNEEVEVRANTVWAVELMVRELQNLGRDVPSYQLDWMLWHASQDSAGMAPYHRTRTVYY